MREPIVHGPDEPSASIAEPVEQFDEAGQAVRRLRDRRGPLYDRIRPVHVQYIALAEQGGCLRK